MMYQTHGPMFLLQQIHVHNQKKMTEKGRCPFSVFFVHRYFYIANKNKYSFLKFYFKNTLNIKVLLYII